MGIDEELKLFEKAEVTLRVFAMESVVLYAIANAENLKHDQGEKILSLLKNVGEQVVSKGYSKNDYEVAIDDEIQIHDQNSLLKYGFTASEVVDAMGEIWCEEAQCE